MILELPNIISGEQRARLHQLFDRAPRQDGAMSAGPIAQRLKANIELVSDSPEHKEMVQIVLRALIGSKRFDRTVWPVNHTIPIFSEYQTGMHYHEHFDVACTQFGGNRAGNFPRRFRADISATLFLNAPEEYQGGELIIQTSSGNRSVKAPAGTLVVYPSGYRHRIDQVTGGVRRVVVMWFQSYFRDPQQRDLIVQLDNAVGELLDRHPEDTAVTTCNYVLNNLLRMWADNG